MKPASTTFGATVTTMNLSLVPEFMVAPLFAVTLYLVAEPATMLPEASVLP